MKGSWIALVDVVAKDGEEALAAARAAYRPGAHWPLKLTTDQPDKDGWTRQRAYDYLTSLNEQRDVSSGVAFAGGVWTVTMYSRPPEMPVTIMCPVASLTGAEMAHLDCDHRTAWQWVQRWEAAGSRRTASAEAFSDQSLNSKPRSKPTLPTTKPLVVPIL